MSLLHLTKIGKIPKKEIVKMTPSPRQGGHTKTRAKTARACGENYIPTLGWRARRAGEGGKDFGKRAQARFTDSAKAQAHGDKVTVP